MRRLALLLVLPLFTLAFSPANAADEAECRRMAAPIGEPKVTDNRRNVTRLCREGYLVLHDNERRVPIWVIQRLSPDSFVGPGNRKEEGNPFSADPDLKPEQTARPSDYRGSGYDQGHMAPAADMAFAVQALIESFYMSNMAPQVGVGMNQHIWRYLEAFVRNWACRAGDIVVVTGPIFERRPEWIGDGRVAVPTGFFKIVYDPARKRALGVVLANEEIETKIAPSRELIEKNIRSIDEIEALARLDFLSVVSDRSQAMRESLKGAMNARAAKGGCPKPA
jgi:endonuclease G, mitochondrial